MEASTIPATASLAPRQGRVATGPLLRLRSDEQLVRLFRAGSDEAFRVIHDRYRTRLFAYARQMLGGSRADAEDALQDVFVRAHAALRANAREVSLRAWLYRIAHNRCIDELRRPAGMVGAPVEVLELVQAPASDPLDALERRESLRRLVEDVQRLPEQQRSALLMREISGMAYADLAAALDVTVPAVKSLLVRARIGLAQAAEARDTACAAIRADLADAHERGVRASGLVKRHLHDCGGCAAYRRELRALDARLAALVPALGPAALVAKLLGAVVGGGSGSGVAGGGAGGATVAAAGAGTAGAGAAAVTAGAGAFGIGATHIVAAVAVAVVSAGGAVEVHQSLAPHHAHPATVQRVVVVPPLAGASAIGAGNGSGVPLARLRHDAAMRLRLRIVPATTDSPSSVTPSLDPSLQQPGTGGVSAPADPAASATPPASGTTDPPADGGTSSGSGTGTGMGDPVGASSGSSTPAPPPPPPDASTPAAPSQPVAPPATTAVPPLPPTSATTGGASYPSNG